MANTGTFTYFRAGVTVPVATTHTRGTGTISYWQRGLPVLAPSGAPPGMTQTRYRWRNDDGSESGASWAAEESTELARAAGITSRLRVQVDASGDPPAQSLRLQYRKLGDSQWFEVSP